MRRGHLRRREAAFLLGCSEREVGLMVRSGVLATIRAGRHHRIAVDELRPTFADQPLRLALLDAITEGRLVAPQAVNKDCVPPSYFELPAHARAHVWENGGGESSSATIVPARRDRSW